MRLALPRRWFNHSLRELVSGLPYSALLPLALAIASLFAVVGPVTDLTHGGTMAGAAVVQMSIFSAGIAVAYAFTSLRRHYALLPVVAALNVAWTVLAPRGAFGNFPPLPPEFLQARLKHDGAAILLLTVTSYSFFLWFINGTAKNYLRVRAEMELAREIHHGLVPAVDLRAGAFEFVGFSAPSGEVGGDLVDVVAHGDEWLGYVADVSGHGVSSGVVMGMFKSALRMRLRAEPPALASMLDDLNAVLLPLKNGAMYVTTACVRASGDGRLEYAVAGHLPILRVRGGRVDEITTPQIPIGMFADYRFSAAPLDYRAGDLLALITDGLTEVFDRRDRELGLEAIKTVLAGSANQPLRDIADALVAKARAHGAQIDDQTVLLIRS